MLDIQLEGLDNETRMKLLPREQELVKELEQIPGVVHIFSQNMQSSYGIFSNLCC